MLKTYELCFHWRRFPPKHACSKKSLFVSHSHYLVRCEFSSTIETSYLSLDHYRNNIVANYLNKVMNILKCKHPWRPAVASQRERERRAKLTSLVSFLLDNKKKSDRCSLDRSLLLGTTRFSESFCNLPSMSLCNCKRVIICVALCLSSRAR